MTFRAQFNKHLILAAVLIVFLVEGYRPSRSQAQYGNVDSSLEWSDQWPRFRPVEYVGTSLLAAGMLLTAAIYPSPTDPNWRGGILFDTPVRSFMSSSSPGGRGAASTASDILVSTLVLYPFVIDVGVVSWGVHGSEDVAVQMMGINSQSFFLTGLVTMLTKNIVGRQRPYAANCGQAGYDNQDCGSSEANLSFLSGHTSMAFTGAGLICAHHGNLPLYGSRTAGAVACGTALAAASCVGALRLVADKHHLTDVLAGAVLGIVSGFLLPTWLHYQSNLLGPFGGKVGPYASSNSLGIGYDLRF